MKRRQKSNNTDIIQIIIKPFLIIGFVFILAFGLIYYFAYVLVTKISRMQNRYGNLKGFVENLKSIVFSNTIKNHTDVYRKRNKMKKSRKQSAEYIQRPKGRLYISSRQEALDMQKEQVEPKKRYFFKRMFAYASIFFLREDIRKAKALEIDQKYPPRQKKEKEFNQDVNVQSYDNSAYPQSQKQIAVIEPIDDIPVKKSMLHKRIMIASASVIVACAVIFVGALAYAQELPANLNFISPKPTADLFQTMVPVAEGEVCEIIPEEEAEIYMEHLEETEAPQTDESEITQPASNEAAEPIDTQAEEQQVVSGNITTEAKVLRQGDEDPEVAKIQARLMELHYMGKDEVTNYYGKNTTYAMEYFQRQHGLQVDGSTGAETLAVLYSDEAQPYKVQQGTEGSDVKSIQQRLYDLKYLSSRSYITGYFGSKTEAAVKDFQSTNGLSADGIVGYNTYSKLFSSSAKKNSTSTGGSSSGGSSTGGSSGGSSTDSSTGSGSASDILAVAKALKAEGYEYVWGGKKPSDGGFDCSGFVYYVLNTAGIKTGYKDSSAWASTTAFPRVESIDDLQPGDVCVFEGHVGLYYGNMQMIHSTRWNTENSSFSGILISTIDTDYRRNGWICGYRVAD